MTVTREELNNLLVNEFGKYDDKIDAVNRQMVGLVKLVSDLEERIKKVEIALNIRKPYV